MSITIDLICVTVQVGQVELSEAMLDAMKLSAKNNCDVQLSFADKRYFIKPHYVSNYINQVESQEVG